MFHAKKIYSIYKDLFFQSGSPFFFRFSLIVPKLFCFVYSSCENLLIKAFDLRRDDSLDLRKVIVVVNLNSLSFEIQRKITKISYLNFSFCFIRVYGFRKIK